VNSKTTDQYWVLCYHSIRKYYPENQILIIDDNSNYEHISTIDLYKTTVIQSEYHQRVELVPYYYYLRNKLFDTAVIIHDSVFINKYIDMSVENYKMLWDFGHRWDQTEDETKMIKAFNDPELLAFYQNKSLWTGCFGGMAIITYDFLKSLNDKYDLSILLNYVLNRYNRCSFERVIACLLQKQCKPEILFGDIFRYTDWKAQFSNIDKYSHLPMIKIWTGR